MAIIIIVFFLLINSPAYSEVVIDDDFADTAQVDMAKTTASVDTENQFVHLPFQPLAGVAEMLENSIGYATASKAGIQLYELDDSNGMMSLNPIYAAPWATDATGVSLRQDNLNIWAITSSGIAYYKFNGAGMTNDPALKVTGLVDVLSVTAFKNTDSALLLQRDGNKAKITKYDAGINLNPELVFEPDIEDPVKVSMVDDSPDFKLFTTDAAYYFSYDDASGTYVEDPAKRITGLTNVISASSDDTGNTILTETVMGYYVNIDGGGASRVEVFSPGPVNNPVAVSLKPGTYEQIFIDADGNVQWWTYDDGSGQMVRDSNLETAGLILNKGYAHPRDYFSVAVNTLNSYDAADLTVTDDKPDGTTVNYFVSSDGGITFTAVTPQTWTAIPRGTSFVVKATLNTTDSQETPKIMRVALSVDENFVLEGSITPQPVERGAKVNISARAIRLTNGQVIMLDSCSVTYPLETKKNGDPALPGGQVPTNANMVYNPETGFWEHSFIVPEITHGHLWPDDGVYLLIVNGRLDAVQKKLNLDLEVNGNILNRLIIRTTNW